MAFWLIVFAVTILGVLWVANGGAKAEEPAPGSAPPVPASVVAEVRAGIAHLLTGISHADERFKHIDDLARIIAEEARLLSEDPQLVSAISFRESSYKPEAVGKRGEVGLMQVHSEARVNCERYVVERRKLDPTKPRGQIACGTFVLAQGTENCGTTVQDPAACVDRLEGCQGALAWYVSGHCSAEDRGGIAKAVRYRLVKWNELASLATSNVVAMNFPIPK
jgi:hypothetical protein